MNVVLVSRRPEAWRACTEELRAGGCGLSEVADLEACKARLRADPPRLILLDPAPDEDVRRSVMELLMIDARTHTAVASTLDPEAFHEAMEGLGILDCLPLTPGAEDARRLLRLLAEV
ncbi:response regulator receiver protein [Desulfovibrio sp.]|uniref:response regulator receiver protein n=1 Tax=Desulfovibrio sp. TaxID=885 RepID=UPI0025C53898|nr:response regulator receiver protein [Desulfovibrio sp.]